MKCNNVKEYDKICSDTKLVLENLKINFNYGLVIGNLNTNSMFNKFDNWVLTMQGKTDIVITEIITD